ncbi:hypothetical protein EDB83DRAFT_335150 [Lactarius deliciosus]|nr:hypothetical protein EDB83DRAFT_335150 [Lactarius deliciosus]
MFQGEPDDEDGTEANTGSCAQVSERSKDNADDEVYEGLDEGSIWRNEGRAGSGQRGPRGSLSCRVLLFDFPCSCQVRHTTCPRIPYHRVHLFSHTQQRAPFPTGLFDAQYISTRRISLAPLRLRQYADMVERSGREFGDGHARRSNFVGLLSRMISFTNQKMLNSSLNASTTNQGLRRLVQWEIVWSANSLLRLPASFHTRCPSDNHDSSLKASHSFYSNEPLRYNPNGDIPWPRQGFLAESESESC